MAKNANGVAPRGAAPPDPMEELRARTKCEEMAALFASDLMNDLPEDLRTKVDIHIRECSSCFIKRVALQIAAERAVARLGSKVPTTPSGHRSDPSAEESSRARPSSTTARNRAGAAFS